MRIAFVPQNAWYFTCCASSSARILAWLSAAAFFSAAATAVPRSFQLVILLAADRSALAANRTQESVAALASLPSSLASSSGLILAAGDGVASGLVGGDACAWPAAARLVATTATVARAPASDLASPFR